MVMHRTGIVQNENIETNFVDNNLLLIIDG